MSAILAKALNSTLGTENFKGFDKILEENVRLVGSDEIFYVYDGTYKIYNSYAATDYYVVFDIGGCVNVYAKADVNLDSAGLTFDAWIIHEADPDTTITITRPFSRDDSNSPRLRLNVIKGDRIAFRIRSSKVATVTIDELYIGATVVPCQNYCTKTSRHK